MASSDLFATPVIFEIAGAAITRTVVTTWGIMAVLAAACWLATRRLHLEVGMAQTAAEAVYTAMEDAVRAVLPRQASRVLPLIATFWVYIVVANLIGIIPGLRSPTDDLSQTAALAVVVFLAVHAYGLRAQGLRSYLRHYLAPNPVFLPFHVMGELTRTIALTVRLAGNVMSLEMAALLVLMVAGFLVPVPILMLHIVEALVQAYIFGMLALIYVAGAIQLQDSRVKEKGTAQ